MIPSWNADIPFADCSCNDWDADKEGPGVFTDTKSGSCCGSIGLCIGGVRAACTPLMLKDSDLGGKLGSEILLATLCGIAGEL